MAGTVLVLDGGIVLGALVDIVDHQPDRGPGGDLRAGRFVVEHAREDAHLVGLLPLRRKARLAGPALVEIGLDIGLGQRDAGRAAIDHAANRGPVAFAKGGDAEEVAESVKGHGLVPAQRCRTPQAWQGQMTAVYAAGGMNVIRPCRPVLLCGLTTISISRSNLVRNSMSRLTEYSRKLPPNMRDTSG